MARNRQVALSLVLALIAGCSLQAGTPPSGEILEVLHRQPERSQDLLLVTPRSPESRLPGRFQIAVSAGELLAGELLGPGSLVQATLPSLPADPPLRLEAASFQVLRALPVSPPRVIYPGILDEITLSTEANDIQGNLVVRQADQTRIRFRVFRWSLILVRFKERIWVADLDQLKVGWACEAVFLSEDDQDDDNPDSLPELDLHNVLVDIPDDYRADEPHQN